MNKAILEFIDKIPGGYLISYANMRGSIHGAILLPTHIYDWYINAKISQQTKYSLPVSGYNDIKVFKKLINNNTYMILKFNNRVLYIPDKKFTKNIRTN